MPLSYYDAPRRDIARIQSRLNATLESLRGDQAFSDKGRQTEMAKATVAARQEADTIRKKFAAEREARKETLEKRLYGISGTPSPAELMVLRDSRDRAAELKSAEEAQTKLRLANQAGDTYMAKAIAQVATNKGWTDVVTSYADTAPASVSAALEELADIPSGPKTKISEAAVFRINPPNEFSGKSSEVIDLIARGQDDAVSLIESMGPAAFGSFGQQFQ